ncbi:ABC transporter substrate-binding protein [Microlunatus speluncae]|uniref:ABC transporter substrate-binding protein n=1 Tax=Microlunatus speluncae TaxID=2594267 RepID=UPI0012662415|nr:extracellular solute-binding protein [Microlunatus speluncae]
MKLRRIVAAASAAALTAIAATGCAGGSQDSAGTPEDPVTIKFQSLAFLPESQQAVKQIVEDFNTANPAIKVELVQGSWDSVHDQLVTQFAGGTAPDVIHDESADVTGFAKDGYLADLSGTIDQGVKAGVEPGVWDAVTVDGAVIAAPTLMQSYLVFANKKLLDAAGVTVPTGELSWDDLAAMAKQLKEKTGKPGIGWGLKSPTATFMNLGLGFGGNYFDGTGADAKIKIGEPELEVPRRVAAMAADGSLDATTLSQSGSEVLPGWYAGKYALTVQGSFQAAAFIADAPKDFEWVALPPLKGSVDAAQAANPQTLSVSADSEHQEQATAFVNYFMQAANLAAVAEGETLFPTSKEAQEKVLADTGGKNGWDQIISSGRTLKKAPFQSVDDYPAWKDQIATPAFQQFLAGKIDAAGLQAQLTDGWATVTR